MPIRIVPGTPGHDVWVPCDQCGNLFLGQPFEPCCPWCISVGNDITIRDHDALLWPEWMQWGDTYWELSPINRAVWRATRGVHGDYVTNWQRAIFNAITHNVITDHEHSLALERYSKWKATHSQKLDD